jgi:hypothetical protein
LTREPVCELIKTHTGRQGSARTAGRYLKDWGFGLTTPSDAPIRHEAGRQSFPRPALSSGRDYRLTDVHGRVVREILA